MLETGAAAEMTRSADLNLFKSVADNASDFIGITNMKEVPVYINKSGLKKVGLDDFSQVIQTTHTDYFHPDDRRFIRNEFMPKVLRDGNAETEIRFKHFKTGEPIWMQYNANMLHDADGRPYGFSAIGRDISTHKLVCDKLAEQLIKRTAELGIANYNLRKLSKEFENFTYVASHDLQEPLRKITVFSDILKTPHTEIIGYDLGIIDRIQSSSRRMIQVIDDLLELSRVSTFTPLTGVLDMNKVLKDVVHDLRTMIRDTNANIVIDDLSPLRGDNVQVKKLFKHLLHNALIYAKPGMPPDITLKSRIVEGKDSDFILEEKDVHKWFQLLELKDHGIGFDPVFSERIFKIFQCLNVRTEDAGTGIGLAIAKKVVENHNGYITAVGQPGVSATFKILFPLSNH